MNTIKSTALGVILGGITLVSASIPHDGTCLDSRDLYKDNGCVISATQKYKEGLGTVQVKVYSPSGNQNLHKAIYVAGGYIGDPEIEGASHVDQLFKDHIPSDIWNTAITQNIDIIYMNYISTNDDYIQRKSYAMVEALKKIQFFRSGHPATLVGFSMGGVISRYAMRTMELRNEDHGIETWASYDAPHKGAHTPLAIQGMPKFLSFAFDRAKRDNSDFGSKLIGTLGKLLVTTGLDDPIDVLFSTNIKQKLKDGRLAKGTAGETSLLAAALLEGTMAQPQVRQIMIQNILSDGKMHPDGVEFFKELDELGLPQNTIRNIAVANGSIDGQPMDFGGETEYFSFYTGKYDDLDLRMNGYIVGATSPAVYSSYEACVETEIQYHWRAGPIPVCIRRETKEIPTGHTWQYFDGKLTYPDASDVIGNGRDYTRHTYSVQGRAIDNIPCGTHSFQLDVIRSVRDALVSSNLWPGINENNLAVNTETNCFIPTYSAVAVDPSEEVFNASRATLERLSPFDQIYGTSDNSGHIVFETNFLNEMFFWVNHSTLGLPAFTFATAPILPTPAPTLTEIRGISQEGCHRGFGDDVDHWTATSFGGQYAPTGTCYVK